MVLLYRSRGDEDGRVVGLAFVIMNVTKGRVSQIEQGKVSGHDVIARFATALGGRLHQAIYFDDGDIAAIA